MEIFEAEKQLNFEKYFKNGKYNLNKLYRGKDYKNIELKTIESTKITLIFACIHMRNKLYKQSRKCSRLWRRPTDVSNKHFLIIENDRISATLLANPRHKNTIFFPIKLNKWQLREKRERTRSATAHYLLVSLFFNLSATIPTETVSGVLSRLNRNIVQTNTSQPSFPVGAN